MITHTTHTLRLFQPCLFLCARHATAIITLLNIQGAVFASQDLSLKVLLRSNETKTVSGVLTPRDTHTLIIVLALHVVGDEAHSFHCLLEAGARLGQQGMTQGWSSCGWFPP